MLQCHPINTNLYFQYLFCTILPIISLFFRKTVGCCYVCISKSLPHSKNSKTKSLPLVSTVKTLDYQNHLVQSFFCMLPPLPLGSSPFPKTAAYSISVSSRFSCLGFRSVFNSLDQEFSLRSYMDTSVWPVGSSIQQVLHGDHQD